MADHTKHDFDWVTATANCSARQMFDELKEGARLDVERRHAMTGRQERWRFEFEVVNDDRVEVAHGSGFASSRAAVVAFERVGPRIHVHGDGVEIELTAVAGLNASGECRYFVGEAEYLGWEVRKMALDLLFFEEEEDEEN